MMTDKEIEKARMGVGLILGIFLIYLIASAGGIVPNDYNVFKYFEDEPVVPLADGEGYVSGIPTEVNVTAQENNTFQLTFYCNESYISGMVLTFDPDASLEDTEFYWTATSTDWYITDDQLTAEYVGEPLGIGVEINDLILHVDGGDAEGDVDIDITTTLGELDDDSFSIEILI